MARKPGKSPGKRSPLKRSASSAQQLSNLTGDDTRLLAGMILHSPIGTAVCDRSGRILFVNDAMSKVFGTRVGEFADIPEWAAAVFPDPDLRREVLSAWKDVLQQKHPPDREYLVTRKDGELRWAHFHIVHAPDGKIIITGQDITKRKTAELELHETTGLLRGILNNIPVVAFRFDRDGFLTESWGEGLKRLNLKPGQAVGMNVFDLYPQHRKEFQQVLKGRKMYYEAEGLVDGNRWCFATHMFPDPDRPGCAIGFALDVTEHRHTQEELNRLAAAVNSAAESIVITDVNGTVLYVNPCFEQMTGYSRKEIIGKNPSVLSSGKHDDKFYKGMWTRILAGKVWRGHFTNRKKDGTLFEEQAVISPVKDRAGRIVNFVAVKRDVTQEHHLQTQIRRSQKMAAIGQLAHKVAHDFTNALVTIQGNAELIKMETRHMPKLGQYLNDILSATNRISSLTAELLAFAHPARPVLRLVRLDRMLRGVEEILRRTAPPNVRIAFRTSEMPCRVNVDSTQIEQVVMHLAINAIEAMPDGGELTIETKPAELSAAESARLQAGLIKRHRHPGDFALLTVSDTGKGMTHETELHIFEPFYTTKESKQNPGLGLTTVYSIIEGHNGHIVVNSQPRHGSTFSIYLPMVE